MQLAQQANPHNKKVDTVPVEAGKATEQEGQGILLAQRQKKLFESYTGPPQDIHYGSPKSILEEQDANYSNQKTVFQEQDLDYSVQKSV